MRTRILACKQQLAQAVSLAPGMEKQQRDLEQLAEENKRLRDELEKWRAYSLRTHNATNPAAAAFPGTRLAQPTGRAGTVTLASSNATGSGHASATTAASLRTHTVKGGETPSTIARKYGVELKALLGANPRLDPKRMQVGQVVVIPGP